MHPVHNQQPTESPLSPNPVITSVKISPHKKPVVHAYALPQNPPDPTKPLDSILAATIEQPADPTGNPPLDAALSVP